MYLTPDKINYYYKVHINGAYTKTMVFSAIIESYPPADYENAEKTKKYTFLSESYTLANPDESSFWGSSMDQSTFIGGTTNHSLVIRGIERPDSSSGSDSRCFSDNLRQDLVLKLVKAIRGEETGGSSAETVKESNMSAALKNSLLDELRSDNFETPKPPVPPPPPPAISQSIKVLSSG